MSDFAGWQAAIVTIGVVAIVILGGHYLSRPVFRNIAQSGLREVFTASALLLVVGIALLMILVGLSPALGTSLAGVVLATSEYRYELGSDIEPFRGLLLGLIFITVGASIDVVVLFDKSLLVKSLTLAVMSIKARLDKVMLGKSRVQHDHSERGWQPAGNTIIDA